MNITYSIGDLTITRLGLGTMRMADRPDQRTGPTAPIWAPPTDRTELVTFLRAAVDSGVDHVDTADAYALGAGEELLAEALAPVRDRITVATKVGTSRPSPTEWVPHGRPEYLRQQIELSLRRLRTDRLDLVYLHRIDEAVPLADQLGALKQAHEEGKVRALGVSQVTADTLREVTAHVAIQAVQNSYSLGDRTFDDVVDLTAELGAAFVAFFPLAMGTVAADDPTVARIAARHGATRTQVALAWLLSRGDHVVPIPGTTSLAHLRDNLGALRLELTDTDLTDLTELSSPA
ncbi:aldo/keto reductase [Actinophytocola xanthii]|uniref:Oxidoreductase n=1 Tax=Actinophytocola xanthii TaxID=1912961 RepID=A0A1Q8CL02_9PSEU|nr:aldo/keto reductase [Actinophytocola xanthii]OLF15032.1 oxidoreductase [Actinophytocola xanthii]